MTQVTEAPARTPAQITERTLRGDHWRRAPAATALLSIWVACATARVPDFRYLILLYSPCVRRRVRAETGRPQALAARGAAGHPVRGGIAAVRGFRLSRHSRRRTAGGLRHLSGHPARCRTRAGAPWLNGRHAQPARGAPGPLTPAGLHIMPAAGGAVSDLRFPNQIPS
jgi:hypothetical protein